MPGIEASITTDFTGFDQMINTLAVLPQIVEDEALDIAIEYQPRIVEELGTIAPPRGDEKFVWSHDPAANRRAQRKWFAMLRSGEVATDGKHYKRSGKFGMGWDIDVSRDGDTISITVFNKWKKSWTVFGGLRVNVKRPPIPGHATTGWQAAAPKLPKIFSDMTRDMARRIAKRMKGDKK